MKYDSLDIAQFDEFYEIICQYFPEKETKNYDVIKTAFLSNKLNVITLVDNKKIVGIISYYELTSGIFIEYFAIIGDYQSQGLGYKMLQHLKEISKKKIILEVEQPLDSQSKRRIKFYLNNQFILNNYEYIVNTNKMIAKKKELHFLLMSYPEAISEKEYLDVYNEIMKEVY